MSTINKKMTEKDALTDMITEEKGIVKLYSSALTESVSKQLREVLKNNMLEAAQDQFMLFELMQGKNYYQLKDAPQVEIDTAKKTNTKMLNEMKQN